MRKASFILLLVLYANLSFAQVGLKGVNLGEQGTDGEIITNSIGGVEGGIITSTLKDGRIYSIAFMPSADGVNVDRIYESDVTRLVNGLNSKFGVKLKKVKQDSYSDDAYYSANFKDNGKSYKIFISTENNEYKSPTTKFTLWMSDVALDAIADKEKQEKANDDF